MPVKLFSCHKRLRVDQDGLVLRAFLEKILVEALERKPLRYRVAMAAHEYLELIEWRRAIAELYAAWRRDAPNDAERATIAWREARDRLYREHPQSPVPASDRASFRGRWWPYDLAWRGRVL